MCGSYVGKVCPNVFIKRIDLTILRTIAFLDSNNKVTY